MNQGIAFARTIRALEADDFRRSKFGFVVAAILLVAWAWWMVGGRVPQYASAAHVRIEAGRAIAEFSASSQIRAGESATVQVNGQSFAARVASVTGDRAELVFVSHPATLDATAATSASAEVEISRVSPASIVLRSLGRARP